LKRPYKGQPENHFHPYLGLPDTTSWLPVWVQHSRRPVGSKRPGLAVSWQFLVRQGIWPVWRAAQPQKGPVRPPP